MPWKLSPCVRSGARERLRLVWVENVADAAREAMDGV
jgi:hypothetical protein